MSLKVIRLCGIALLACYALTLVICRAIPDSVGLIVIAFAAMAAASPWVCKERP